MLDLSFHSVAVSCILIAFVDFYRVEYCLESVERYSEDKIQKSEPGPRNDKCN